MGFFSNKVALNEPTEQRKKSKTLIFAFEVEIVQQFSQTNY